MIFETSVVLCGISIVLNAILLLFNYQNFLKHKAFLERISVLLLCLLLTGLIFLLINFFYPELIIFQILYAIETIAFALTVYGFFEFVGFSGESRPQKEKILIAMYLSIFYTIITILFSLNFNFVKTIEGHLYFGLDFESPLLLIVVIIAFCLPIIHLGAISVKKFLKVYEESLRYPLIGFLAAFAFLISSMFLVIDFIEIRITIYYFLISALILGLILNRKYPSLLVDLAHKFAFKTLFIIHNNGQTIFSHQFAPLSPETKEKNEIGYLVGGFIYALTHGIKEIVKTEYETNLRIMDFGKLKMLFYYGNQIFGVLFSREANSVIYNRLQKFIDKFEDVFPNLIQNPTEIILEGQIIKEADKETIKDIQDLLKLHFNW